MNCKTQVALAAGIGYVLGRQHKLRWGLLLAAAAASGRLSRPGSLLQHGIRALGASKELGKLGEMGAPLVAATKDAARHAVTNRIASVSDRLRERTDALYETRERGEAEEEPEEREEEREPRRPARRAARRARPPADEYEQEDEGYEEEDEDQEKPVTARAGRVARPPVRRRREG